MKLSLAKTMVLLSFVNACYGEADYIKVKLNVITAKDWAATIEEALTTKLNAIPDVQVMTDEKCADCVFQIYVDVNKLVSQADKIFGYDMMVLILGTYDSRTLTAFVEEGEKNAATPAIRRLLQFEKYMISGNIFLAGMDHFYGPTDDIASGYDKVVSLLKSKGMPRYREFEKELADMVKKFEEEEEKSKKQQPTATPKPKGKAVL